jgi:sulfatase maturation enzyme AslB (radical SAM superfamily)
MTWDTAKDIIHWLVNNQKMKKEKNLKINESGKEKIHLAFFGGEPMLMYEKII